MCAKIIFSIFLTLGFILVIVQAIGNEPQRKMYFFSSTHETWFDALSICRTINQGNFSLLKIEDNGKSHQLQNYFKKRTFGNSTVNGVQALNYWTAGKRNYDQTDQWTWVASEKAIDFTAWAPGQPDNNNYYGEEHCIELLHFTQTGLFWNDANCLIKKQFICESL